MNLKTRLSFLLQSLLLVISGTSVWFISGWYHSRKPEQKMLFSLIDSNFVLINDVIKESNNQIIRSIKDQAKDPAIADDMKIVSGTILQITEITDAALSTIDSSTSAYINFPKKKSGSDASQKSADKFMSDDQYKEVLSHALVLCQKKLATLANLNDRPSLPVDIFSNHEVTKMYLSSFFTNDSDRVITTLSNKLKNDILLSCNMLSRYYEKHSAGCNMMMIFDKISPFFTLNQSQFSHGDTLILSAGIGMIDTQTNAKITIDGKTFYTADSGIVHYKKIISPQDRSEMLIKISCTNKEGNLISSTSHIFYEIKK